MLHTLDVNLVIVEEGVHRVRNLDVATALLLEALLGEHAEVLGCPVSRRDRIRSILLPLGWNAKLVGVGDSGPPDGVARRVVQAARDGGASRCIVGAGLLVRVVGGRHEREVHLLELIGAVSVATLGLFYLAGER